MEKKFRMAAKRGGGSVDKWHWRELGGLVSHGRKFALSPKDSGRPFHDLFCLLERSLWLIAETGSEGSGDHRAAWQPSGWRVMGLVTQGSGQVWNVMERQGDFPCESWGEGVSEEAHAWELDGWCGWGAQERSSGRRRMKRLLWPLGVAGIGETLTFLLTTAPCPDKHYLVQLPLQLRNGDASRGSDTNNIKINTIPEFPSRLQFVSHWPEQCPMLF